jgi:hypothetical protein
MRIRASIIVIAFVITSATWGCVDQLKDDPKYQEMKQIYATLPIYPDSRDGSDFGASQRSFASYGRYYAADISYEGLKRFYSEKLPASGWEFSKEEEFSMSWFGKNDGKQMNFSRGVYTVSVSYVTKEANAGWDYSLSVKWRSKGDTQQ